MTSHAQLYTCNEHGVWRPPHPPKAVECAHCWALYGQWHHARGSRRKELQGPHPAKRKQGRGSKAKGRAGVVAVVDMLRLMAPWLGEADIYVKATSQMGADIHLSPRAQAWLNYAPEIKNVERLDIWGALRQAEANAKTCPPVLFFTRARTGIYVALRAEDFLKLLPCPPSDQPPSPSPTGP